ncbi:Uncharacterized conserved protein YndB, AHSA1/START domain [Rhodococcus triatomae]|uniref:Uncharacterized conserved protein YndB, AHSA1/START domain n=1 Tax=Rhodococcus triatomae TaxID=300028 RepID=A0A1G8ICQ3_9NOCA|nr:SRPBCC domain-containing protein [Rhodococcus triatomae]SDI16561.1 Uncharacterized conserved protein YndB, AHSA1/START domain [Rhodococcus triatomae]
MNADRTANTEQTADELSITRTVVIAAPRARVWAALTEAEQIGRWLGQSAELDLRVGGSGVFTWDEYGPSQIEVTEVQPPASFGFRWAADVHTPPTAGQSTLVRFTLVDHPEGTELTVTETGFETLDRDEIDQRRLREGNVEGWRIELGDLAEYLTGTRV